MTTFQPLRYELLIIASFLKRQSGNNETVNYILVCFVSTFTFEKPELKKDTHACYIRYLPVSPSSHELLGDTSGDNVVGETSPKFCKRM